MATTVTTSAVSNQSSIAPVNGHAAYNGHRADTRPDAPDDGRYVTKEAYWTNYYTHEDASYEWNNGYLEAKPLSTPVQYRLFLWFLMLLHEYVMTYDNADLMSLETGFTMTVPDPDVAGAMKEVVRKPDLAAIRHDNQVAWGENDHSYHGICDLCIESLSDSRVKEILRDTNIKKSEYAFAGVQEYYILDPSNMHMSFFERSPQGEYVPIQPDANGVIRSRVLPGFQFRLTDLQRQPLLEEMAFDEVYHAFVLPGYRVAAERATEAEERALAAEERALVAEVRVEQEQRRVEQEQRRVEQEQRRAEQERLRAEHAQQQTAQAQQRAERYAARLLELGITLDDL